MSLMVLKKFILLIFPYRRDKKLPSMLSRVSLITLRLIFVGTKNTSSDLALDIDSLRADLFYEMFDFLKGSMFCF